MVSYYIYTGIVSGVYKSYDIKTITATDFVDFHQALEQTYSRFYLNILNRILNENGKLLYLEVEIIVPNNKNIVGFLTSFAISNIQLEDDNYSLFDGRFNKQLEEINVNNCTW